MVAHGRHTPNPLVWEAACLTEHATSARWQNKRIRIERGGYRRDHLRALAQRVEVEAKEA